MKGLNLSRGILVLLLLWTLSVVAGAAGAVSTERGGAGRSQRRGGGGGGGGSGADKRRRFHRIQHGQCSYTFILPELDGCQSGGSEQYGGSRSGASIVQRDSPPVDGEWSAQKLQHLESTMENNTQWLRKRMDKKKVTKNLLSDKNGGTCVKHLRSGLVFQKTPVRRCANVGVYEARGMKTAAGERDSEEN
ncbi:Angiopoietin-1 [Larimichthys crocea]|uniref:Angiopoietin-1 n=1 Tax=Larimichthys crocea TaxID=215358 RepID=A0A6G0J5B6_LARCR|nr:Angiopoietin-1 [Larimichthys crocea]